MIMLFLWFLFLFACFGSFWRTCGQSGREPQWWMLCSSIPPLKCDLNDSRKWLTYLQPSNLACFRLLLYPLSVLPLFYTDLAVPVHHFLHQNNSSKGFMSSTLDCFYWEPIHSFSSFSLLIDTSGKLWAYLCSNSSGSSYWSTAVCHAVIQACLLFPSLRILHSMKYWCQVRFHDRLHESEMQSHSAVVICFSLAHSLTLGYITDSCNIAKQSFTTVL